MATFTPFRGAAALWLALLAGGAGAQTAATPAAEGKTLSLGSGTSTSSKLLTRDELRACLKQRDSLASRSPELERQRKALDAERDALAQDREALKTGRDDIAVKREALAAFASRQADFKKKSDDFQLRLTEFNDAKRTGMSADRQRADLAREHAELSMTQQALDAERPGVNAALEESVNRFNANAATVDAKATDWNQRNGKLNEQAAVLDEERQIWAGECSNRRYRETDEQAIRRGP